MTNWRKKRQIMQRYDITAQMYDERYAEEQEDKYKKALGSINLTSKSLVLDLGCGSGLFFKHIGSVEMVAGVDISRRLLLQAKQRSRRRIHNCHLLLADADHLPFKDGVFGEVFAFTVLQNMPKPIDTLNELKRVAKQDGRFVVTGLKKAFLNVSFIGTLDRSGLEVTYFSDDALLKCYIATCIRK